jgi:hypothetical protein
MELNVRRRFNNAHQAMKRRMIPQGLEFVSGAGMGAQRCG